MLIVLNGGLVEAENKNIATNLTMIFSYNTNQFNFNRCYTTSSTSHFSVYAVQFKAVFLRVNEQFVLS